MAFQIFAIRLEVDGHDEGEGISGRRTINIAPVVTDEIAELAAVLASKEIIGDDIG